MKYGCIGERLGHSFSAEIHRIIADYEYELCEVAREDLDAFMTRGDFEAVNVTIPYKESVIPHMAYIDAHAEKIGAVNTVVNRGGKLYGYNTDFFGLCRLLEKAGIDPKGKKALILGTGGTSKTAAAVLEALGAKETVKVSRNRCDGTIDYNDAVTSHTDADIIINTTPVGMYPSCDEMPIDVDKFTGLSGVIDAVYNPLRTRLVSRAAELGIPAMGGLYMLVAQAVMACEIFTDKKLPGELLDSTYDSILSSKENIVLVGMPTSGKSTVGGLVASLSGREFLDTDTLVTQKFGMTPAEIITARGEGEFRRIEMEAVAEASRNFGVVIATGGGAPLYERSLSLLKQNGRIYFLDRSPEKLLATPDRPLSGNKDALMRLYQERYPRYTALCDLKIDGDGDPKAVAKEIIHAHGGRRK